MRDTSVYVRVCVSSCKRARSRLRRTIFSPGLDEDFFVWEHASVSVNADSAIRYVFLSTFLITAMLNLLYRF